MTTITKNQEIMVIGLLAVGKHQNVLLNNTVDALREFLGEKDEFGHCADAIYSDYGHKQLFERLDIQVAE